MLNFKKNKVDERRRNNTHTTQHTIMKILKHTHHKILTNKTFQNRTFQESIRLWETYRQGINSHGAVYNIWHHQISGIQITLFEQMNVSHISLIK